MVYFVVWVFAHLGCCYWKQYPNLNWNSIHHREMDSCHFVTLAKSAWKNKVLFFKTNSFFHSWIIEKSCSYLILKSFFTHYQMFYLKVKVFRLIRPGAKKLTQVSQIFLWLLWVSVKSILIKSVTLTICQRVWIFAPAMYNLLPSSPN